MDSASHSSAQTNSPTVADADPHPSHFANALGILIALTTLAFPLFAIAHFSAVDANTPQSPFYPLVRMQE